MNILKNSPIFSIFWLSCLLLFYFAPPINAADFDKGMAAYKKGYYKTAIAEIKPLAQKGDVKAQFNLGKIYSAKKESVQDETEAINWFTKAANQKHNFSQFSLGHIYSQEKSVYKDYVKAFAWYNMALSRGNETAREGRDKVMMKMTPDQVAKGQALYKKLYEKIYGGK